MSNVWEICHEIKEISKQMGKNHKLVFVPIKINQYSRHFLQNPKVLKNAMGFINRAQRFTAPYYLDVDSPLYPACV